MWPFQASSGPSPEDTRGTPQRRAVRSAATKRGPDGRWSMVSGRWSTAGGLASSGPRPHVSEAICWAGCSGGRVAGISGFRRHCARQRAPLREGGGAQRRGENAARALARVGPGFVRAEPVGHKRADSEACLAHGRDEARPATFSSRLSSRSLARPAPPFVIRHCGFPMDDSPARPAKPLQTEKVGVGASPGECEE